MKKLLLYVLVLVFSHAASAQTITAYRYWYDNSFTNAATVNGSFGSDYSLDNQFTVSELSDGLHSFNIAFKASTSKWSSTSSSFFYKQTSLAPVGQSQYQYWFDNDFSNALTNSITSTSDFYLLADFDVNSLSNGLHSLNIRFRPDGGAWSVITSSFFYKSSGSSNSNITNYQYWFDNNVKDSVTTIVTPASNLDLTTDINTVNLSNGLHVFNIRFKQENGSWSVVKSEFFNNNSVTTINNKIKTYRYWFDQSWQQYKEISIGSLPVNEFTANVDVESLSEGLHTLSSMFKDANGLWSSPVTSFFTRGEITNKIFIEPKVYVKKATLNVGDVQTITGSDFTSSGEIQLTIKNSLNEVVGDTIALTYINYGKFTYSLPITNTFQDGEYKVDASDVTTGSVSPEIKFRVVNPVVQNLWINEPSSKGSYSANQPIQIHWADFISKSNVSGKTGYVTKIYRIEFSKDNGSTWQLLESAKVFDKVKANQNNDFLYSFSLPLTGNFKIKVTDIDNTSDYNYTTFSINTPSTNDFITSLEWDSSMPKQTVILNPVGLAADGTSRIFVKLARNVNNKKLVKRIDAIITPLSNNFSGTALLGKILFALNHNTYNEGGNLATNETTNITFGSPSTEKDYWFWLVAPDDFTQDINSQDAERTIKVSFTVTYSDNTTATQFITARVVRPPLMLVHGLNGSAESFDNAKYNVNGTLRYFKNAGGENGLFKDLVTSNLKNYASYKDNADILLGIGDIAYHPQSFQRILKIIQDQGFAANRVDYVCHSMGGCIARTVLSSQYDSYFKPTVQSDLKYKNYGKGFINKLITINTPHNGSPVADFMADFFKPGNGAGQYLKNSLVGAAYNRIDFVKGFFQKTGAVGYTYIPGYYKLFDLYDVSAAVKDLQATHGGITFSTTKVKNHLIGANIDDHNILSDADFIGQLHNNESVKLLLNIMNSLIPGTTDVVDAVTTGPDAIYKINNYLYTHYGYYKFLSNSDFIVPTSSQFPGIDISGIPNVANSLSPKYNATIAYGVNQNHIMITDGLAVGTKLMQLLNSPINSTYFADEIAPNTNTNIGGTTYEKNNVHSKASTSSTANQIINYIDTNYIKIISPETLTQVFVDSTTNIKILIKDSTYLQKIQLVFQGEYYESTSKTFDQTFNVKVHSDAIGYNQIVVDAMFDSSGYTIYHTDTTTLLVKSLDSLIKFYITPKTQNLNRAQTFQPIYNTVYSNYIGVLNDNIDSLSFKIADTNVVKYIDTLREFTTKDTGTTYIIFNYRGLTDTGFIYVSSSDEPINITNLCPHSNTSFYAGTNDSNKTYQWQENTGKGFINVINDSVYSGATSPTLTLSSPATSLNGYSYRCIVNDSNSSDTTASQTLTFSMIWTGARDSTWENTANWSCGTLPDENTDVSIPNGQPNNPVLSSNASVRSIQLSNGSDLKVSSGYNLLIKGVSKKE